MTVKVRSFAKINLGLRIGAGRADGFHELRTIYQTIGLHDVITVQLKRGSGIEIHCSDPRVPKDDSNTCYRIAQLALAALKIRGRVVVEIEKRLPMQGGLGGASGNAVSTMLAIEQAAKKQLPGAERLRIAAEVGSDLPLFLVGGTILGVGRGEEVYPLPDLPGIPCVVVTPDIGVSTPKAFADWDRAKSTEPKLTENDASDKIKEFGRVLTAWLIRLERFHSGVPASGRSRAETPLLDLVRTGIENDFEKVVFPQYPELSKVKSALERAGAFYASLSGSGSAIYGLFENAKAARDAADTLNKSGIPAVATASLTRRQYWKEF
jgi:4-diphosphocytidyl-2-C-methyl-D-erythritol kinase